MTLQQEIKKAEKILEVIYANIGKDKAFGDPEITKTKQRIDYLQDQFDRSKECKKCEGKGVSEHCCDCIFCDTAEEECDNCDGEGRVW